MRHFIGKIRHFYAQEAMVFTQSGESGTKMQAENAKIAHFIGKIRRFLGKENSKNSHTIND